MRGVSFLEDVVLFLAGVLVLACLVLALGDYSVVLRIIGAVGCAVFLLIAWGLATSSVDELPEPREEVYQLPDTEGGPHNEL